MRIRTTPHKKRKKAGGWSVTIPKEKNMTSFSAIKEAQKELGFSKAGHGGTLDPLATGVLPIFFDQPNKIKGFSFYF